MKNFFFLLFLSFVAKFYSFFTSQKREMVSSTHMAVKRIFNLEIPLGDGYLPAKTRILYIYFTSFYFFLRFTLLHITFYFFFLGHCLRSLICIQVIIHIHKEERFFFPLFFFLFIDAFFWFLTFVGFLFERNHFIYSLKIIKLR